MLGNGTICFKVPVVIKFEPSPKNHMISNPLSPKEGGGGGGFDYTFLEKCFLHQLISKILKKYFSKQSQSVNSGQQ